MGWLQNVSKLVDVSRFNPKKLGALGETMLRAQEDNPGYFALGRPMPGDEPLTSARELSARHGLNLTELPGAGGIGALNDHGIYGLMATPERTLRKQYAYGDGWQRRQIDDLLRHGKLGDEDRFYQISAGNASANSGFAKQGYPAMWEHILGMPGAANITDVLSNSNQARRSANMVGALERWGDRAGDRILIDPSQFDRPYDTDIGSHYQHLDTHEKIGLLNAKVAANTDAAVNRAAPYVPEDYHGALQALFDDQGKFDPSLLTDPTQVRQAAEGLRLGAQRYKLANPHDELAAPGYDTLRRAAIVAEQMKGTGLKPIDLSDRPWLTTGIARKAGGSV